MRPTSEDFQMTEDDYRAYCDHYCGFCLVCGAQAEPIEPDAREYTCESCGEAKVYGVEELLMMGVIEIV